ncbi:MAG: hypothetical protein E7277_05990 [Lachnospiraceae bacterium]|nr:hypothetical protein [Lachnospiraceae bacterium]
MVINKRKAVYYTLNVVCIVLAIMPLLPVQMASAVVPIIMAISLAMGAVLVALLVGKIGRRRFAWDSGEVIVLFIINVFVIARNVIGLLFWYSIPMAS